MFTSTMEGPSAPLTLNGNETEASAQIYMFGDQTITFEHTLNELLHVKDNAALSDFFDRVSFQLRSYLGGLPPYQQDLFPHFTTLIDLFARHEQTGGAPALKFTLLCVTEIAQFIRYHGQRSKPYPSPANTYLVGACTGSFAAAAISTSQSIGDLISPAVEVVIVAFRTALCSLLLRNDLELPVPGESKSWSAVVGIQETEAVDIVRKFNAGKCLHPMLELYASSVNHASVSISGPPRLLTEFLSSTSLNHLLLPIEAPYHAAHLFSKSKIDEIVGPFHDPSLEDYKQRLKIVSVVSGEIISSSTFRDLIRRAVSEALLEPLQWDIMTSSLTEELVRRNFTTCDVYQVSSRSGSFISSALTRDASLQVNIVDSLEADILLSQLSTATGKFSQSSIAIIGYSGRFPESASNEEFWELLMAGRDVHRTIPEDRYDWKAHYDPTGKTKNTSRVKYGCFINEPGLFDARFFNMSPRECENCDPAQRLAITSAYEAIEMAGLVPNMTPSTQQDRIGVFYGVTSDDWREVNSGQDIDTYFIPGGNRAFIPGRISYFFRFCGPSLSVDTACSSSFAAIQTACVYLWRGECDTAVAGGANVLTNPDNFAGLDRGHFLSTTGNCNAFDDTADGYCRSDAVGTVILKRLEDAIADNDPIFGVIRGAYTNHCGRTDSITRPFEGDQVAVFNRIMRYAGVDSLDVGYVEMHGTGTQAGDATEMKSVLSVFAPDPKRKFPLYLGTVKANIGHAESASGVASLIKVLLMMKHNAIPPHCGIKTKINHNYPKDLTDRNVHIPFQPTPWYRRDMSQEKRTVFLNNFSAAGGNTAVLLEDAPARHAKGGNDPRSRQPVTVTGKTLNSLKGNVENLVRYLVEHPDTSLSSLSYTTTARRIHQNYRAIVSGPDVDSIRGRLQITLENISETKPIPGPNKLPNIIFVFTGQGTFYKGLGKQLFDTVSIFRESIIWFDGIAQQQGFPSFLPLVNGSTSDAEDCAPVVTNLALVCVQMALHGFWKALGVTPAATIGHSLGEYPAMYAAGVLTAANVIYLVGTRARLLTEKATLGTHAMLAVKQPANAIKPELSGTDCEIACLNQPSSNVISGPSEQLSRLRDRFKSKGIECIPLEIPFAFHSAQVDPILVPFEKAAGAVRYNAPSIPYISPFLRKVIPAGDTQTLGASYLTNACRQAVNFQGAIEAAQTESLVNEKSLWVEIGSHPACAGMIKGTLGQQSLVFASLRKNTDTWSVMMPTLEGLYSNGIDIQWSEYHRGFESQQEVIALPRYAWDLKNYWIQYRNNFCLTKGNDILPAQQAQASPAKQNRTPPYVSPSVQKILEQENGPEVSTLLAESDIHDRRLAPILEGHAVNGALLCPSSLYADIALTITNYMMRAINIQNDATGLDVADMKVMNPLVSQADRDSQLYHVAASAEWKRNIISFKLFSVNDAGKKTADHATFVVRITPNHNWIAEWQRNAYLIRSRIVALHDIVENGNAHKIKRTLAYQLFSTLVRYSQDYQGMQEVILDSDDHEATAKVSFQVDDNGFTFNPCWVDSLGHIAGFIMNASDATPTKSQVFINHGWERMRCAVKFAKGKQYQVYNRMQLETGTTYVGDTYIFEDNTLVAIYEGIRFQGVPRQLLDRLLPSSGRLFPAVADKLGHAGSPRQQEIPSAVPAINRPAQPKAQVAKATPRAAPKSLATGTPSGIASCVMAIISKEAGVDLTELQPNEDFANHGIDSLLSLTICGRIQEELGADVPSSLFVDYPTPKELIEFFGSGNNSSPSTPSSTDNYSSRIETPGDRASRCDTEATSDLETDTSVLDVVRATIAEETGIPISELTLTSSFADLGVDSLLALTIVGKLTEALEVDLPSSLLMDNENLEEVSKALGLQNPPVSRPIQQTLDVERISSFDPRSGPQSTSILLWGNPKRAKKILFLFPDGSGSATSYVSLPKLGSDTAAYGLNCPWMKTPQDMTCTLEELTAKYLLEIRRRQPVGPYFLGGWSAGGICAYEAAQQLARDGSKTEQLILIDSPNPIGLENPPQRMYDFFDSIGIFGTNGKAPPSWLRPHFDAFIRLLDDYKIKPFVESRTGISTHILYARDGICNSPSVPRPEIRPDDPREMKWLINNRTDFSADGWASLVGRSNLHITVLSNVNHFSMMDQGPHMQDFAQFLHQAMA